MTSDVIDSTPQGSSSKIGPPSRRDQNLDPRIKNAVVARRVAINGSRRVLKRSSLVHVATKILKRGLKRLILGSKLLIRSSRF